jgi:hypothetical protein
MARRRGQFADLGYPVTPMLAHKWTRAYDGADFGPSRNGDGTVPAVARSLREYGRAMARRRGQFADLGYPVTPMLARKLAQVVGATDFGPSRNGDGTEPAAARRLRECGRATARRRGQLADLGYPVTPMVAHMIAEHVTIARRLSDVGTKRIVPVSRCSGRTSIFHLNFSCSGCMRGVHHRGELRAVRTSARWSTRSIFNHRSCRLPLANCASAGEAWRDARVVCLPCDSGHTDACTHGGGRGRRDRFSTAEKRFRRCESVGERWRDGAACGHYLGFPVTPRLGWRGWSTRLISDCREAAVGLCPWPRTDCEGVGER